ncbi:hypothetical protein chiPu_0010696 [Chiloscyllium punctatum]|uniref:Uncharacterized protein n=1 Tax=Chiloscyllium punctatum TaxID=137246 RepID=A0A401SPA5_CHIPU|nr:hypothetical protein [Chiloscyllium punctatum]
MAADEFDVPVCSQTPKILQRGPLTQAAPWKEEKFYRNVSFTEMFVFFFSDSIANNYSPAARNYSTDHIYKLLSSCESLEQQWSDDPELSLSLRAARHGSKGLKNKSPRTPLGRRK